MATKTAGTAQPPGSTDPPVVGRRQGGLPRYYPITALVLALLFTVAGGLIYYRLAVSALIDRVASQDAAFAQKISTSAPRTVVLDPPDQEFERAAQAEMALRPVIRVRVFNMRGQILVSTDASEIGQYLSGDNYYYWYRPASTQLEHYDSFRSGQGELRDREIATTTTGLPGAGYDRDIGLEINSDVTAEIQAIVAGDATVAGVITLVLACLLIVAFVYPRRV